VVELHQLDANDLATHREQVDLPEILGPRFSGKRPLFAALLNTARRTPPG
jgi:hypothetical protein